MRRTLPEPQPIVPLKQPRIRKRPTDPIGPHSQTGKLRLIDRRRSEAKLLLAYEAELIGYLGGDPDPLQRKIIQHCALLQLRLHLLDKATLRDPIMNERASRYYLAWHSTLLRSLAHLHRLAPHSRPKAGDDAKQLLANIGRRSA